MEHLTHNEKWTIFLSCLSVLITAKMSKWYPEPIYNFLHWIPLNYKFLNPYLSMRWETESTFFPKHSRWEWTYTLHMNIYHIRGIYNTLNILFYLILLDSIAFSYDYHILYINFPLFRNLYASNHLFLRYIYTPIRYKNADIRKPVTPWI